MDNRIFRITVVENSNPGEYKFAAVVYGNKGPTDFKDFSGNSLGPVLAKASAYIEEREESTPKT